MQLKTIKWIVLLLVVIHTTSSTTQDQEPMMDSDYFYQDTDLDDTSGFSNEAQENARKYFFSSVPRAAIFPSIEQLALAAAESTTECIPEKPEKTTTTECAPIENATTSSSLDGEAPASSTTSAPVLLSTSTTAATPTATTPSVGGGGASYSTSTSPTISMSTTTVTSSGTSNGPSFSSSGSSGSSSGSSSSSSSSSSVAGISNFNTNSAQTSDQEAKSRELRNLVQHLYIAQARVQLEATEIKKSQAVANVAQQQLEEAAGHVRTVTAALQNAQQEVAAAAIRAQTAQLQLAAHDQLLFAARQDVDALSSQMVGLQAAEGISAPRITFDVTGLLEKLKQPLSEEQKPTPVPSVLPMPSMTPKTTKVQRSALQELYYE